MKRRNVGNAEKERAENSNCGAATQKNKRIRVAVPDLGKKKKEYAWNWGGAVNDTDTALGF